MDDQQFEQNIRLILRDDKSGLKHIYEAYCPMIFSVVSDILRNREDAEDVTSEFFIRLWDIADTYKPGRGHRAWIITIARNMAVDCLRKKNHETPAAEIPDYLQEKPSAEDRICRKLSLEQALLTLKKEERQIVNLKIMGELTFREIAKILKKPPGTVAWRYRTAMEKLKEVQL